jgi:formate dehydrogenase subunit gamma
MSASMKLVPRFRLAQRVSHWVFVAAFFVLLFSGLALFVPAVSAWTASANGRIAHRVAAVVLMLAPILYLITDRKGLGQLVRESFTYDQDDRAWFKHFIPYTFGKAKSLPPQGRVNAGEKLHHAAIILGFFVISVSGLMLWFWDGMTAPTRLTTLMVHDVAMIALAVLTVGHVFFVFVYGAFSGMWNGSVTELYARVEHPKWFAQMKSEGKIISR